MNMIGRFHLAIAQLNPTVGDIVFTELFICGYWPEEMLRNPVFIHACEKAVCELALDTKDGGPGVVIGLPIQHGRSVYNAVALLDKGKIITKKYHKIDLSHCAQRIVLTPDEKQEPVIFRGLSIGLSIGQDLLNDRHFCKRLAEKGAQFILVSSAAPFIRGKTGQRYDILGRQVQDSGLPIIYANQFGGQDEMVFDGGSFALAMDNSLAFQMKNFQEDVVTTIWEKVSSGWQCVNGPFSYLLSDLEADYSACMIGLADYVNKNNIRDVVLGLSGGIDSALCAAIAVDALGKKRVHAIMLPYKYTSQSSCDDAALCARLLGCRYDIIPISGLLESSREALAALFSGGVEGLTAENLQSRMRGTILMAVANEFDAMLLTTGNKSEIAVGYATLYGDMNGGFNPLKDLYKTQVYALSEWRNTYRPTNSKGPSGVVIPQNIIEKAPSAELHEGQIDEDSLPPYPVLDDILECLVDQDMTVEEIMACGYDKALITEVEQLLYIAEYKRRQSAPGVNISGKSFGRDRCYPITNRFRTVQYLFNCI